VRPYLWGRDISSIGSISFASFASFGSFASSGALEQALARDIQPIDDVRSTGEYRMHVAHRVLRRALSLLDRKS